MFTIGNTTLRTISGTIGTLVCAGICLMAATAPAQAADSAHMIMINHVDLNLANDRGRDALDARIKSAARSVCASGGSDVRARTDEARCVRTAINQARTSAAGLGSRGL